MSEERENKTKNRSDIHIYIYIYIVYTYDEIYTKGPGNDDFIWIEYKIASYSKFYWNELTETYIAFKNLWCICINVFIKSNEEIRSELKIREHNIQIT